MANAGCGEFRIKRISSQPFAFRQHRLRVRLPDDATLVPCVAAKPALAYLPHCALALNTPERSADTVPNLSRNNSPEPRLTRKRHRRSILLARSWIVATKRTPSICAAWGSLVVASCSGLFSRTAWGVGGWGCRLACLTLCLLTNDEPNGFNASMAPFLRPIST